MKLRNVLKISVLSSLLVLAPQAFSNTHMSNGNNANIVAQTPEEDAAVTHTVSKLINESKTLSQFKLDVTTNKGVVTISGNVDSDAQASSAVELAESVIGVSDVDTSKLTIKGSQQPLADSMITAKIKGLFIREKLFGEKDIAAINTSVETVDGVVHLTGVVDNKAQIDNAIEIIRKNVPEVKKVEYSVKKITPAN